MCLGQPSRVPGGSILAIREMGANVPVIRRPYGCLLNAGYIRRAELRAGSSGRRAELGWAADGGRAPQADGAGEG
jgi:hypothetical protein